MGVLNRKLRRDMFSSAATLTAVIVIIAVGTGSFIGLGSAQRILKGSQRAYYDHYRFADFWVHVKKAPEVAAARVADLPDVAEIRTRVLFDVILDLPGVVEPLSGRLISTPARGFDQTLNGICLVRGSGFSDDRDEEVILSNAFAEAHGLQPGDRIELILNRKRESFVIAGTAISPEYVYMVRGEGDFAPDAKRFAVLYVKDRYAREVLDFQDACNEIVGRLVPGAANTVDEVDLLLERIDRLLDPYGVLATTPRARQASNRFLSDEIAGLAATAVILPGIFLGVAALVLNVLASRMAQRQRTIIGTLKALGYSNRQVLGHFLGFGVLVGLTGGAAGVGLGMLMAMAMIEMYKTFFQFPTFVFEIYPDLLVIGLAISVVFALLGTTKGVWAVLRLEPAEAMRSQPPERGGAIFLERWPGLWRRLGFRTHIALRSLARNRVRTATNVLSAALATAIILTSLVLFDSVWFLLEFQFDRVVHSDADVGMRDERSVAALLEARQLPGVDYAEPVLGMVCDLRHGRHARRVSIIGLPSTHRLTTPLQADLRPIEVPPQGLVFSRKLAEVLDLAVGDRLDVTPVRGQRQTVSAVVASTVEGFLGLECYADLGYLSGLVGEARAVNSVQLRVDPAQREGFFRAIKRLPNAQGLSVPAQAKANLEATFAENLAASLGVTVVFAGVIAFGTILSSSFIEIADRTRDVATFRVLGYRPGQIAGIFFRQNLVVFALGTLLALPLGWVMVTGSVQAYDTELFRMPVVWSLPVLLGTALVSLLFVLIVQGFVYRQVSRLDWLEGVKIKE